MAYLKHIPTGDIYPFNPDLAKVEDMEPCDINGVVELPTEVVNDPGNAPPKTKKAKAAPNEPDEFLSGLAA